MRAGAPRWWLLQRPGRGVANVRICPLGCESGASERMRDAVARMREWREMLGEQPVKGPPDRRETPRRGA